MSNYIGHTTKDMDELITKGLNKVNGINRVRRRMRAFYEKYADCNIYFSTFTFNKEHYFPDINSFTKYLRRNGLIYCLYPDYGEENMRYHLHGFIVCEYPLKLKKKGKISYTSDYFNLWGYNKLIDCKDCAEQMLKYSIKYSVKFGVESLDKQYQRLLINDKKDIDISTYMR